MRQEELHNVRLMRGGAMMLGSFLLDPLAEGLKREGWTRTGNAAGAISKGLAAGGGAMMTTTMMGFPEAALPIGALTAAATALSELKSATEQAAEAMKTFWENERKLDKAEDIRNLAISRQNLLDSTNRNIQRAVSEGDLDMLARGRAGYDRLVKSQQRNFDAMLSPEAYTERVRRETTLRARGMNDVDAERLWKESHQKINDYVESYTQKRSNLELNKSIRDKYAERLQQFELDANQNLQMLEDNFRQQLLREEMVNEEARGWGLAQTRRGQSNSLQAWANEMLWSQNITPREQFKEISAKLDFYRQSRNEAL